MGKLSNKHNYFTKVCRSQQESERAEEMEASEEAIIIVNDFDSCDEV